MFSAVDVNRCYAIAMPTYLIAIKFITLIKANDAYYFDNLR